MTAHRSPRLFLRLGFGGIALLFGGFGLWAATHVLSGAVIVPAYFDTGPQRQVIQHTHGGRIAEVAVRDGMAVTPGTILVQLDNPDWTSQHSVIFGNLIALQARRARLRAEQSGDELTFGPRLSADAAQHPNGPESLANERALFQAGANLHHQTLAQLDAQDNQFTAQIQGLYAEQDAVQTLVSLVAADLAAQQALFEKGLTQASRVSALDQQIAHHARDMAQIETQIAQLGSQSAQLRLNQLRLETDRRQKSTAELRDVDVEIAKLTEDLAALEDRLASLTLRAPITGTIHGIAALTPGAVVAAGAPLFEILPDDGSLRAVAMVEPGQIDLVQLGQPVRLMLSDFGSHDTPELTAAVSHVAADARQDPNTGARAFRVEITLAASQRESLSPDHTLQPGMSAQAFFVTQDRTVLSMLVGPMASYFQKAFQDG